MNRPSYQLLTQLAAEGAIATQEALAPIEQNHQGLRIVVPKEVALEESRLSLTPDAVALLCARGHEVAIEAGAGILAKFSDHEFSNAGAKMTYSPQETYQSGNLVMKVNPPTLEEIQMIQTGSSVVSALQTSQLTREYMEAMNSRKITGLAFELMEDEVGNVPVVRAMSEIAGSIVLFIAAECLSSPNGGKGLIMGGITGVPPTKVVIIGAGTVGEFAARAALGLGAEVKIFDNQLYKLRRIKQEVGAQLFTSTLDLVNLTDAVRRADVVVGAIRPENGRTPCVVNDEMVASMRPDSVVVDVSIDQGGCFETSRMTTHSNPTFRKYDVIHYCVPNMAARVAHTATAALSNILVPMMLEASSLGGIESMIFAKDWFMRGVYCYGGSITNKHLAKRLEMRYKDLALLRIARM